MNSATLTAAIRDFGSAKEVARIVGCSEATAARYRRGQTMPDPVALARLMGRSRQIAQAMLRLAGLDDLSMDLEEAHLRRELRRLQTINARPPDVGTEPAPRAAASQMVGQRGYVAKAADAMSSYATARLSDALDDVAQCKRERRR